MLPILLPPKTFRAYIFSDRFSAILRLNFAKFQQNFSDFSEYENLDISPSEIIEILRNSGKNPLKFDEKITRFAVS